MGGDGRFANRPYGERKVSGAGDCYDDKIPRGTRNDMWGWAWLFGGDSAVDDHFAAGHVGGLVGGEE